MSSYFPKKSLSKLFIVAYREMILVGVFLMELISNGFWKDQSSYLAS